jgi:hypothetical protein
MSRRDKIAAALLGAMFFALYWTLFDLMLGSMK